MLVAGADNGAIAGRLHLSKRTVERHVGAVFAKLGVSTRADAIAAEACLSVARQNLEEGVTWVHSYVSSDRTRTFCIYDAPSPEAVHAAAGRNGLPVDDVTDVRVLDPYFYSPALS